MTSPTQERISGLSDDELRRIEKAIDTEQRHTNVMSEYFLKLGTLRRRIQNELRERERGARDQSTWPRDIDGPIWPRD